jgi:hypothetical protein
MKMVQSKPYLGVQNAIKLPYLSSWSQSQGSTKKPNLAELMGFLQAVISSDPPVESGYNAAMMNGTGSGFFPPQQTQPQPSPQAPYGTQNAYGGYPPNPYGGPPQYPQQQQQ